MKCHWTTIFVKKVEGGYRLMTKGFGAEFPAGTRLWKGTTKEFPNGPPDISFGVYTSGKEAYAAAEKLQGYVSSL